MYLVHVRCSGTVDGEAHECIGDLAVYGHGDGFINGEAPQFERFGVVRVRWHRAKSGSGVDIGSLVDDRVAELAGQQQLNVGGVEAALFS
ncbi:MAG: hypothetical protein ACI88C_003199 [Acidimicrobiales bacterium]|jgi:hypothetical protein